MIKNKIVLFTLLGSLLGGVLTSCEDFLSETPDNRTEINSKDKVKELLANAYPMTGISMVGEMSSDNVTDNGPTFSTIDRMIDEAYAWDKITTQTQDSPYALWNNCYTAIASTNHALEYIDKANDPELDPYKGEALLCRAYNHFMLANVFCLHYAKDSKALGIPYVDNAYYSIMDTPDRGTIVDVYEKMKKDIEEALPLIDDNAYASNVVKYHFNKKAANAFAARFYLYYGDYKNAIKCATVALGADPAVSLRNYKAYFTVSSAEDIANMYIKASEPANLLLQPVHSIWFYNLMYTVICRYVHSQELALTSTIQANGPWTTGSFYLSRAFGSEQQIYYPKYTALWEITDVVAQSGFPHIVNTAFTTDETLLTRAEAYALSGEYGLAAKDLGMWYDSHTSEEDKSPTFNEDRIQSFFAEGTVSKNMCPTLNPDFNIVNDKQRSFLNCILYFRRCESLHEGLRWADVKRYGIEVTHKVYGGDPMVLKKDDPRRAIQLPDAVIGTGMTPNPR